MRWLRLAWRRHHWLTMGFLLSVVLALVLTLRFTVSVVYWSTHRDLDVEPWMTLGYVARSHRVPRGDLVEALTPGLRLEHGPRETLMEIAARTGMSEAEVVATVEAALAGLEDAEQ